MIRINHTIIRLLMQLMHIKASQSALSQVFVRCSRHLTRRQGVVMGIAIALAKYLAERSVPYDVVEHPHTQTASESAGASRIPPDRVAKAVVLKGGDGFILAVLPASRHIQFGELCRQLGQDIDLANEEQIETLFLDCESGAVPALGAAYGLKVIVDSSLASQPEIYFEGGDHSSLVHISGAIFRELLADAPQAHFTGPA